MSSISRRVGAYEQRMRKARLSPKTVKLLDEASIRPALTSLFRSSRPPDALFTTDNICTTSVIAALHELEIRVPGDVAIIGFDDLDFYALVIPTVTTIRQPVEELGRTAARLLLDRIRGEFPTSNVRMVLPATLIVRESCGCPKA
jgi:LacI family transcriptional regulator